MEEGQAGEDKNRQKDELGAAGLRLAPMGKPGPRPLQARTLGAACGEERQQRGWVGTGPGAGPPAESPSSAQLEARYGSQGLCRPVWAQWLGATC